MFIRQCKVLGSLFFVSLTALSILSAGLLTAGRAHAHEKEVFERVKLNIEIYGEYEDTVYVEGTSDLYWSDPYFDSVDWVIDTEIISMNLYGSDDQIGDISVHLNGDFSSSGQVNQGPSPNFPAESFFNLFVKIVVPGLSPGDTLHNNTPLLITSTIDAMPPYFDPYETDPGSVLLYDQFDAVVGEISYLHEKAVPYSPPEAFVSVEESKGSNTAVAVNDSVRFDAAIAGTVFPQVLGRGLLQVEPQNATFGIRESGTTGPFVPFYTDFDGGRRDVLDDGPRWGW